MWTTITIIDYSATAIETIDMFQHRRRATSFEKRKRKKSGKWPRDKLEDWFGCFG